MRQDLILGFIQVLKQTSTAFAKGKPGHSTTMSFDRADIYATSVLAPDADSVNDLNSEITKAFKRFVLEFSFQNDFIYRNQLRQNILSKQFKLTVHSEDLILYHEELHQKLFENPKEIIPLFERAITEIAKRNIYLTNEEAPAMFPQCQLILLSNDSKISIRDIESDHVSKIIKLSGIIINTSMLNSRASELTLMCRNCRHEMKIKSNVNLGLPQYPKKCLAPPLPDGDKPNCPPNPYLIVHDKSSFIDQQILKLQETSDMVPVGELPRHITIFVDRYLCNVLVPGTRCEVVGIYDTYQKKVKNHGSINNVALRTPYLKVLGVQTESDILRSSGGLSRMFSEQEEEEFLELSRLPNLYERFVKSIAPSIYGNEDIKKAITCLLFGGSKKVLPDGMRLRGDINVLLLGDPGTAKSQLLKFVEKVSPIAIYTSGKGSSAAGLTASVQRDPATKDFYLEGGAMVLADGGVICIDEFDKMRDEDRVAIHEAMEQQTISIAKAGITTVLNSRTSVLAAANPIFGRYDEMKAPGENIDFQTTILSRFDMIFIVKDSHNSQRDISIAQHVMNVHTNGGNNEDQIEGEIPIDLMKRYIQYAKLKCAPRLTPEAAQMLSSNFVAIRKEVKAKESMSTERSSIPITIRQLEAIIRITESLAKMELSPTATIRHVEEAMRLFNASTMDAIKEGNTDNEEVIKQVTNIESDIKKRLPMGWSTSYNTLRRTFVEKGNYNMDSLNKALSVLERREVIQFRHNRTSIFRCGV